MFRAMNWESHHDMILEKFIFKVLVKIIHKISHNFLNRFLHLKPQCMSLSTFQY